MKCDVCGSEGHVFGYWGCPGIITRKPRVRVKALESVPNSVIPGSVPNRTESARVGEWKKKNVERVRLYQREYMRRKRRGG